jgi:hypothetical protein
VIVTASINTGTGPLQGDVTMDIGTGAGNGTVTYTDLRMDVKQTGAKLDFAAGGAVQAKGPVVAIQSAAEQDAVSALVNLGCQQGAAEIDVFVQPLWRDEEEESPACTAFDGAHISD